MKKCPVCKNPTSGHPVQPQGFWERWFLALLLFRPYRCHWCRKRFRRFGFQNGQPASLDIKDYEKSVFSDFLPPEDGKKFSELLLEIREAERKMSAQENASDDTTTSEEKRAEEQTSDIWEVIDNIRKT